ncbi:Aminodeoxychorismate lyase [Pseudoclavibacter triregionum]|nr:Aminodeoxychorismate lyase [Pseudoclavibacter triregionum]
MTLWRWDAAASALAACDEEAEARSLELLVADSWLVRDGRVRALERHRARFEGSCAAAGCPVDEAFWSAVVARLPREGAWFPRVELATGEQAPELRLRVRPAPPLGDRVALQAEPLADQRRAPLVKGPDLELLGRLRDGARSSGADELVLVDPDGRTLETATANLLWWDGATLCRPADALGVFPGVTAALCLDIAAQERIAVREEQAAPEDLREREVWLVNALHGIRSVSGWGDEAAAPADDDRLARWRAALDAVAAPLP